MGKENNGLIVLNPESINSGVSKTQFPSRKAYVYNAPYLNDDELSGIIRPNTHLRLTLNSDVFDDFKQQEIRVWTSTTSGQFLSETSANGVKTKKTDRAVSLNFYTPDYIGNNETNKTYFITLDKPFEANDFESGKQTLYNLKDLISSIDVPDELDGLFEIDSATEGILMDIKRWEDEEDNYDIHITTIDTHTKTKRLQIGMSKYSDLYAMLIRGVDKNGIEKPVPLKTNNTNLTPLLMNIIETKNRLVKYLPWFDYDIALPLINAKKFITPNTIKILTTNEKVLEVILDMFLIAYAFNDEFSFVEYVIEGNDAGKIKGNQYIGYQPKQASSLIGSTTSKALDSRFNRFLLDTRLAETSEEVRIVKQVIAGLSRFTGGQLAIGKGNNLFNAAYLPWYFELFSTFTVKKIKLPSPIPGDTKQVDSFVLDKDTTRFRLKSSYFELNPNGGGEIELPKELSLSQMRMIQTDRKITLPIPGDTHVKQDKLPTPGDIDTKTEKDISFIGYSFVDQANLQQLFGTTANFSITVDTAKQFTSTLPSTALYDQVYSDKNISDLFANLGYSGNLISGTVEEVLETMRIPAIATMAPIPGLGTLQMTKYNLWIAGRDFGDLADAFIPNAVSSATGIASSNITDVKEIDLTFSPGETGTKTGFITFTLKKYRLASGFVYNVNAGGTKTSSIYERQVIFDKDSKIEEIETFTPTSHAGDVSIPLNIELDEEVQITEVIINRDWGQETNLILNGLDFKSKDFNVKDETIAIDRYLLR